MSSFLDENESIEEKKIIGRPKSADEIEFGIKTKSEVNTLWVEKYRPQKLSDYIGNEKLKARIDNYISSGDIPHILLNGPPGTGKTTVAKMIANSVDCDVMYINASDENGVETVREKIRGFAASAGIRPLKVCILDEADFLTVAGQSIMRNLMESFSASTRFIMTCNYVEKIIPAIISRVQAEVVVPPDKQSVAKHLVNILTKESISFELKDIAFLVNSYYPDIRKIINSAQQFSRNDKKSLIIDSDKIIAGDSRAQMVNILKTEKKKAFTPIRQLIADNGLRTFGPYYRYLYDTVDDWGKSNPTQFVYILAESQYKDAIVDDKEINFMSLIYQLTKEL